MVCRFLRGSVYQIPYTESLCLILLISLQVIREGGGRWGKVREGEGRWGKVREGEGR